MDSEEEPPTLQEQRAPMIIGKIISGIIAGIALLYSYCNWAKLAQLNPDALGQTLQGLFAPLAFLWLVVAVLLQKNELSLQREELKNSRKALVLQATELHALVDENKASVQVALETLSLDQSRESERRIERRLKDLVERLIAATTSIVIYDKTPSGGHDNFFRPFGVPEQLEARLTERGPIPAIRDSLNALEQFNARLDSTRIGTLSNKFEVTDEFHKIIRFGESILSSATSSGDTELSFNIETSKLKELTTILRKAACRIQEG